jgi:hypothetical protein
MAGPEIFGWHPRCRFGQTITRKDRAEDLKKTEIFIEGWLSRVGVTTYKMSV